MGATMGEVNGGGLTCPVVMRLRGLFVVDEVAPGYTSLKSTE